MPSPSDLHPNGSSSPGRGPATSPALLVTFDRSFLIADPSIVLSRPGELSVLCETRVSREASGSLLIGRRAGPAPPLPYSDADLLVVGAPALSRFHLALWYSTTRGVWLHAPLGRNHTLEERRVGGRWRLHRIHPGLPSVLRSRQDALAVLAARPGTVIEGPVRFRVLPSRRRCFPLLRRVLRGVVIVVEPRLVEAGSRVR